MKKRLLSIVLLALMVMLLLPVSAFAAEKKEDGLYVRQTTDKTSYGTNESLITTLSVTNTNGAGSDVLNVRLKNFTPDGFYVLSGYSSEKYVKTLAAGETVTLSTKFAPTSAPATGDDSARTLLLYAGMALVSAAVFIWLVSSKKLRRYMSLFLVCCMLIGFIPFAGNDAAFAEGNQPKQISLSTIVQVGQGYRTVYSSVYYEGRTPEQHTLTPVQSDHGNVTVRAGNGEPTSKPTQAAKGTSLVFNAKPDAGYEFDYWEVVSGGIDIEATKTNNPITLTMPETALALKAHFKPAVTLYNITVENDGNGTAKAQIQDVDVTSAAPGAAVTLVATPKAGYQFKEWKVVSGGVTVTDNKFTMPASNVTVQAVFKEEVVPVTGVTLDKTEVTIEVGDEDVKLIATVLPENATDKSVTWSSSDNEVATVDEEGNVHAVAAGDATITVTTNDGSMTATCDVKVAAPAPETYTVTFDLNGATGTAPTAQTIASGSKVTKPTDPTFANHTFAGWYKTKDATTGALSDPWDFGNGTVTADMTLYAKWTMPVNKIPLTNSSFPTSQGNAWKNESGMGCFLDNGCLKLLRGTQIVEFFEDTDVAVKSGSDYIITQGGFSAVFKMTEGVLTSITMTGINSFGLDSKFNGTYAPPVSVTGVTLDKTEVTIEVGDEDVKLTATVLPENATDKSVTWSSSDNEVATVDEEGKVHAVAAGKATITVTTADGGKTASCTVTVTATAPSTFKAVYDTTNDANTLTFYYDNKDHSGENITVYDNLPTAATLPNAWGYNSIRGNIKSVVINSSVAGYDGLTSTAFMFQGMKNAGNISGTGNLNTSKVTDMTGMFFACNALSSLDVSGFDTSNVTNMQSMFNNCYELSSLDFSNFKTSNVTNMQSMFLGCKKLTELDISSFNTSEVGNMNSMFKDCSALETITFGNSFDTSNVTDMGDMFLNCTNLQSLDLSSFNTSKVTKMIDMFQNCVTLTTLDLSSFNTSNVTTMKNMFNGCEGLTEIGLDGFTVGNGTAADDMFSGCSKLTSVKINAANDKIKTALGEGWTYDDDTKTYKKATSTKTVSDVLKTAGTNAPSDTEYWYGAKIDNENTCGIYSNSLEFKGTNGQILIPVSTSVTAAGDNYTYSTDDGVITFNMTNEVLKSITV